MSTEVDICNLALASLGDRATVVSINPPEGSAQAEHCARFYPLARDALLEMHTWGFATRRVQLAMIASPWAEWQYAYLQPNDAVNLVEVLDPSATDDYSQNLTFYYPPAVGNYVPQAFTCEIDTFGNQLILTNQQYAELRYTALISDPTLFSPLFTNTLVAYLASMLAGPVLKGEAGAAEAKRCLAVMQFHLSQAINSDANQRMVKPTHQVSWISRR